MGFLRAAKERSAREYGQYRESGFRVLTLGHVLIPIDLHQKIAATIVVQARREDHHAARVRIIFYRVVWKGRAGPTAITSRRANNKWR